jgi:hypothetical protein
MLAMDEPGKPTSWLTVIGCLACAVVGIFQVIAGVIGLNHIAGWWGILIAVIVSTFLRIELPFMIGTFFCAYSVWRWPWPLALLFTLPGLLFFIPDIVSGVTGGWFAGKGGPSEE